MILTTLITSIVSASAASEVEYTIQATTGGGYCTSVDIMKIKIDGDNGSTGWHDVAALCVTPGTTKRSFYDINVGKINRISVKNVGIDGWYPSKFVISSPSGNTTIFGGKWVDDSDEVTFSTTDNVVYFTLCTASDFGSETDATVYMSFVDEKGYETPKYNLSEMHYQTNAFEMSDVLRRYISLPSGFGKITKVNFSIDQAINFPGTDWQIEFIEIYVKSGKHKGDHFFKNVFEWCSLTKPVSVDFK